MGTRNLSRKNIEGDTGLIPHQSQRNTLDTIASFYPSTIVISESPIQKFPDLVVESLAENEDFGLTIKNGVPHQLLYLRQRNGRQTLVVAELTGMKEQDPRQLYDELGIEGFHKLERVGGDFYVISKNQKHGREYRGHTNGRVSPARARMRAAGAGYAEARAGSRY